MSKIIQLYHPSSTYFNITYCTIPSRLEIRFSKASRSFPTNDKNLPRGTCLLWTVSFCESECFCPLYPTDLVDDSGKNKQNREQSVIQNTML